MLNFIQDNFIFVYIWFCSTNHKIIGLLYLLFGSFTGFLATFMLLLLCLELDTLCINFNQIFLGDYQLYNIFVTGHGLLNFFKVHKSNIHMQRNFSSLPPGNHIRAFVLTKLDLTFLNSELRKLKDELSYFCPEEDEYYLESESHDKNIDRDDLIARIDVIDKIDMQHPNVFYYTKLLEIIKKFNKIFIDGKYFSKDYKFKKFHIDSFKEIRDELHQISKDIYGV